MKDINKITGLIAAPFTPFNKKGEVNYGMIKPYAEKLKSDGLNGVFVCGTTGEGMLMTSEERKGVAECWIDEQTNEFKVIVHVGSASVMEAKQLAMHAEKSGAFAVGSMGPMFLKPKRLKELVLFCKEVASGAPQIPFYYYHIPSISGIDLPMSAYIISAAMEIPNFRGIKFTDNNFMEMQKCIDLDNKKWDILHGFDEMLLAGLGFGISGAVGSTYNYAAQLYLGLMEQYRKGNYSKARQIQLQSVELVDILLKHGGALVAGKSIMKFQGIDCGQCRLPLPRMELAAENALIKDLDLLSFNVIS